MLIKRKLLVQRAVEVFSINSLGTKIIYERVVLERREYAEM